MRFFAILLGIALLFWLPVEDTAETSAVLFAIAISTWLAIALFKSKRADFRPSLYNYILAGSLAGILVTPIALFLMVFKTGLHGHEAPDYTTQQFIAVARRMPAWITGGFLIGMGSGIWITKKQPE
jgi:hypothetical protein